MAAVIAMRICAYPIQVTAEQAADQAYLGHHFNCGVCIAAGHGDQYGPRCDVGAPLWLAYTGIPATSPTSDGGRPMTANARAPQLCDQDESHHTGVLRHFGIVN